MKYIFSPHGEHALIDFIDNQTLLAFDFDGTLAPIVPRPEDACAPTSMGRAMTHLTEVATVAVITGRAISDVRARLNFEPKYIVGNHGAEGIPGLTDKTGDSAEIAVWERQILAAWHTLPQGVKMENKQHSLSLHYRMTSNRDEAKLALHALLNQLQPSPRIIGGKCVVNLLPENSNDKFDALLALQRTERSSKALFVGDDETDEVVFRKALPDWLTIRVGQKDNSAASFYLNSQSEMALLVQRIDRLIRAHK
ncbi:MAG: trehalose-phosphatase [Formivibrio sp.]|nr:trehalose-phosphatase [Formivibrio sp.]